MLGLGLSPPKVAVRPAARLAEAAAALPPPPAGFEWRRVVGGSQPVISKGQRVFALAKAT